MIAILTKKDITKHYHTIRKLPQQKITRDYKLKILQLATFFFMGSIIGSLIDTVYRSMIDGHWSYQSYFGQLLGLPVPFMPVYGLGLVLLYLLITYLRERPLLIRIFIYAVCFTMLEFIGGAFTQATLGMRLWDYSNNPLNFQGHVDILHTLYWILLGLATEKIIQFHKKLWNHA